MPQRLALSGAVRFGDRPYGGFFTGIHKSEIAAQSGILTIAHKLGMTETGLDR